MGKIYLTSDLHFGHDREFIWGPRGFSNVQDHDEAIIKNWNKTVSCDDTIFCLGDCMLNDNEGGVRKLKQLAGHIYIVPGNHDTPARIALYKDIPNVTVMPFAVTIKHNGYNFYLSHYPTICINGDNDKPLTRQVINICGHSHTKDKFQDMDKGLIFHTELDAHNMTPICIDDIIKDIKKYKENK